MHILFNIHKFKNPLSTVFICLAVVIFLFIKTEKVSAAGNCSVEMVDDYSLSYPYSAYWNPDNRIRTYSWTFYPPYNPDPTKRIIGALIVSTDFGREWAKSYEVKYRDMYTGRVNTSEVVVDDSCGSCDRGMDQCCDSCFDVCSNTEGKHISREGGAQLFNWENTNDIIEYITITAHEDDEDGAGDPSGSGIGFQITGLKWIYGKCNTAPTVSGSISDNACGNPEINLSTYDDENNSLQYQFNVLGAGSTGWGSSGPLSVGGFTFNGSGNNWNVSYPKYGTYTIQVKVRDVPWNAVSNNGNWTTIGSALGGGKPPSVTSLASTVTSSDHIRIDWTIANHNSDGTPGLSYSFTCSEGSGGGKILSPRGTPIVCDTINSYVGGRSQSFSTTVTVTGGTTQAGSDYSFNVTASNMCGSSNGASATEQYGKPWMVSVLGDSYANQGYKGNDAIKSCLSLSPIPTSLNFLTSPSCKSNQSTFIAGTYMTSVSDLSNAPSTTSRLLLSYTDQNAQRYYSGNSIYNTITEIKDLNATSSSVATQTISGNLTIGSGSSVPTCSGKHLFFIENDLIVNPPFKNADNTSGCIFVIQGNLTVTPGNQASPAASNVAEYDEVDGFFLVEGTSNIQSDTNGTVYDGFMNYGGLITSQGSFNRNLILKNDLHQPAEIFNYDPKYLELFRSILGTDYSYKIREPIQ